MRSPLILASLLLAGLTASGQASRSISVTTDTNGVLLAPSKFFQANFHALSNAVSTFVLSANTNVLWPVAGNNTSTSTNGNQVTVNADVSHAEVTNVAASATNSIGISSGKAAFAPTNQFDVAGAAATKAPTNSPTLFSPSILSGTLLNTLDGNSQTVTNLRSWSTTNKGPQLVYEGFAQWGLRMGSWPSGAGIQFNAGSPSVTNAPSMLFVSGTNIDSFAVLPNGDVHVLAETLQVGSRLEVLDHFTSDDEQISSDSRGNLTAVTFIGSGVGLTNLSPSVATNGATATDGQVIVKSGTNLMFTTISGGGGGDVTGPASSTDGVIPLYNGTSGKILKTSAFSPSSFDAAGAAQSATNGIDTAARWPSNHFALTNVATASVAGLVKVDNSTIVVGSDGTLSSAAGGGNVNGSGSSTAGHFAIMGNTSATLITNSPFTPADFDVSGSASAATNAIGRASQLSAFAPTNQFDAAGAALLAKQAATNAFVPLQSTEVNFNSIYSTNGEFGIQVGRNDVSGQEGTFVISDGFRYSPARASFLRIGLDADTAVFAFNSSAATSNAIAEFSAYVGTTLLLNSQDTQDGGVIEHGQRSIITIDGTQGKAGTAGNNWGRSMYIKPENSQHTNDGGSLFLGVGTGDGGHPDGNVNITNTYTRGPMNADSVIRAPGVNIGNPDAGAELIDLNTNGSARFANGAATISSAGIFTGNGSGLTNLNASQLASGTVPMANLNTNVITATNQPFAVGQTLVYTGTNSSGQPVFKPTNVWASAGSGFPLSADANFGGFSATNINNLSVTGTLAVADMGVATLYPTNLTILNDVDFQTHNAVNFGYTTWTNLGVWVKGQATLDGSGAYGSIFEFTGGSNNVSAPVAIHATNILSEHFRGGGENLTNLNTFDSLTNAFSGNTFWLGTNGFVATSSDVNLSAIGNIPGSGIERYGQLTIKAGADIICTNPAPCFTSDMVDTRTITNGNTAVISVDVVAGIITNLAIVQFK